MPQVTIKRLLSARARNRALRRRRNHTWTALFVAALGVCVPLQEAFAAPSCLNDADAVCEPDKLCVFKAELASKVFLYQVYLRNSQVTKKQGKRDTVRYDGTLYNAAVSQAESENPSASREQKAKRAASIFQKKVEDEAGKFKPAECVNKPENQKYLPKPGYDGMTTDPETCRSWANFEKGEADAPTFADNDKTGCKELYDRDRAHEKVHQLRCEAAKGKEQNVTGIDAMIEDEIVAYEHSVRLNLAYVRLLSIKCTSDNLSYIKQRAADVQKRLATYASKGG
jgi:hypothetical protein